MNTKKNILCIILTLSSCWMSSCSQKVSYENADKEETLSVDYGSTDLQKVAKAIYDKLIDSRFVKELDKSKAENKDIKSPVLFVDTILNKTQEHIDTESITEYLRTELIESGKFRFIDMTKIDAIKKQFEHQYKSGMVNAETQVAIGKQTGAEYMLYGSVTQILKNANDKTDNYFLFVINIMHLETGEMVWSGKHEIRKSREKALFGL